MARMWIARLAPWVKTSPRIHSRNKTPAIAKNIRTSSRAPILSSYKRIHRVHAANAGCMWRKKMILQQAGNTPDTRLHLAVCVAMLTQNSEENDDAHPADYPSGTRLRYIAHPALQPRLGLLSQRWTRSPSDHRLDR